MTVEDPRATYDDLLEREVTETFTPEEFAAMRENEAFSMGWVTVGVVLDEANRVLLAQDDADVWRAPGGTLQAGESLHKTLRREVREETGVEVDPVRPHAVVDVVGTHRDREDSLSFSVVHFHAAAETTEIGENLGEDDENIVRAAWFDELPENVYERALTAAVLERAQ